MLAIEVVVGIIVAILAAWLAFRALSKPRRLISSDSVVLITGGCGGLGSALAKKFAEHGATLILWDLNISELNKLKTNLLDSKKHIVAQVDVSDSSQIQAALDSVPVELMNKMVAVISNAGVVNGKSVKDLTDSDIDRVFAVNSKQNIYLARALYDRLPAGSIFVFVASVAGMFPLTQLADYCASKFAVIGFAESLRQELRRDGRDIQTCTVCPFIIDTPMFEGISIKFPANLITGILKREHVARRIFQAVQNGDSFVALPAWMQLLPLYWLIPQRLRDLIRDLMGESHYMDTFKGHKG